MRAVLEPTRSEISTLSRQALYSEAERTHTVDGPTATRTLQAKNEPDFGHNTSANKFGLTIHAVEMEPVTKGQQKVFHIPGDEPWDEGES